MKTNLHSSRHPWEHLFHGCYRNGLTDLAAAARPSLAPAEENHCEEEKDAAAAASDLIVLHRLLLAAAETAHGLGMCRFCFQSETRRAYFFGGEFTLPDDELEVARIASGDARPCQCPAAEAMPLLLQTVLSLRGAEQRA